MNPENNPDLERKLQELEAEIAQSVTPAPSPVSRMNHDEKLENKLENWLSAAKAWFNRLPPLAKVAVAVVGVMAVFSLLNSVLKLVASLISIAILGVILYLLYKVFFAPRSSE
jgi:hypothetical protein